MNKYIFSGNLTANCETRALPSGTTVCNFTVAVNDGYGDHKRTEFIKCGMFGRRAEGKLVGYLVKGQKVLVEGRPKLNKREHEGKTYADIEVFVEQVELIGSKGESGGQASDAGTSTGGDDGFVDSEIPF
jgi:single-strand DNA-binding protein